MNDENQDQCAEPRFRSLPSIPERDDSPMPTAECKRLMRKTKRELVEQVDDLSRLVGKYHRAARSEMDQMEANHKRAVVRQSEILDDYTCTIRDLRGRVEQLEEQVKIYKTSMLIEAKRLQLEFASENEIPF